jgi:hypothetical protein
MANTFSAAGRALNFGATGVASPTVGNTGAAGLGDMLGKQVANETDEERLRRRLGFSVLQSSSAGAMSPAGRSLFGGLNW